MLSLISVLGLTLPLAAGAPADIQAASAANNQFAFDLYGRLRSQDGSLFFSPYSIDKTLAMTYAGARGDTAKEMAAVLHLKPDQDQPHRAFLEMRKLLNRGTDPAASNRAVQLSLSANLWGQHGYRFRKEFLGLLRECYGAGLEEVDFGAPDQAEKTINAWVQKQTRGKIPELFPPDSLNINTRLVLASAIYFKGDWGHAFEKSQTRSEAFRVNAATTVPVPLMHQTETFGYFEDDRLQVLRMPYQGDNLAMLVLLPKKGEGLADLEKTLTAEKLATWVGQLREQKVEVALPKFKLTGGFSLEDTLKALGIKNAFAGGEADFSSMTDGREPLFISAVVHRAYVDVNEEGTEAAAATGVAVESLSLPLRQAVPVFRADHPFVFAVSDVRTGVILFLGRVVQP
jgi:serpin B